MIIEAAAILYKGKIVTLPRPKRHADIIYKLATEGEPTPIVGEQGFVDENGKFLNRKEAAKLALGTGQVVKLLAPPNLFSEDLW